MKKTEALAFEAAFWNEGSRFTRTHQRNVGRGACTTPAAAVETRGPSQPYSVYILYSYSPMVADIMPERFSQAH